MKSINISRVLRLIWQKKGISRIDIAKELNLDKSTITNIITNFIKIGIVQEMKEGTPGPQGGRRPIFLCINKDYGCVAGIEIQPNYYKIVLINLEGDMLHTKTIKRNISSVNLIKVISSVIDNLKKKIKTDDYKLIGIGIGLSGMINPETGIIFQSIPLQIKKPFKVIESIPNKEELPILIENDANCCAWAELAFQKSLQLQNFIFVLIEIREEEVLKKQYGGIAVGLGIVINGNVYYGSNYASGEFRSVFAKPTDVSQFSLSKEQLLKINEDEKIFIKFAKEFSLNLALLINTLNIDHVIISSFNVKFKKDIIPILKENIKKNFPYPTEVDCIIKYSSLGDDTVAYGAAGMLLQRLFAIPEIPMDNQEINTRNIKLFFKL